MIKTIIPFLTKWQVQLALLGIQLLFSLFGFYNYFFNYNLSRASLTQQFQDNELLLAKSGAKSIEVFMKNTINQLIIFESNDIFETFDDEKIRTLFRQFINNAEVPLIDIARYDKAGKLSIIENRKRIYVGEHEDFSDRDFIQWSKNPVNENKFYITAPYIARAGEAKGRTIMVIAIPSYFHHIHQGTITMRVGIDEFKKYFLDPLGGNNEDIFILDADRNVVLGKKTLLNQNLIEYAKKTKWVGWQDFVDKLNESVNQTTGIATWNVQYPSERTRETLAAYSKIDLPSTDRDLTLFVTTVKPNIYTSLTPFFSYGTIWLGGSIIMTFIIGAILTLLKSRFHG